VPKKHALMKLYFLLARGAAGRERHATHAGSDALGDRREQTAWRRAEPGWTAWTPTVSSATAPRIGSFDGCAGVLALVHAGWWFCGTSAACLSRRQQGDLHAARTVKSQGLAPRQLTSLLTAIRALGGLDR